eukprot:CFRG0387T1
MEDLTVVRTSNRQRAKEKIKRAVNKLGDSTSGVDEDSSTLLHTISMNSSRTLSYKRTLKNKASKGLGFPLAGEPRDQNRVSIFVRAGAVPACHSPALVDVSVVAQDQDMIALHEAILGLFQKQPQHHAHSYTPAGQSVASNTSSVVTHADEDSKRIIEVKVVNTQENIQAINVLVAKLEANYDLIPLLEALRATLCKCMIILRQQLRDIAGMEFIVTFRSVWMRFYTHSLNVIAAMFCTHRLLIKPHIRSMALTEFRDHLLLAGHIQPFLEEQIKAGPAFVPSEVTQMLFILLSRCYIDPYTSRLAVKKLLAGLIDNLDEEEEFYDQPNENNIATPSPSPSPIPVDTHSSTEIHTTNAGNVAGSENAFSESTGGSSFLSPPAHNVFLFDKKQNKGKDNTENDEYENSCLSTTSKLNNTEGEDEGESEGSYFIEDEGMRACESSKFSADRWWSQPVLLDGSSGVNDRKTPKFSQRALSQRLVLGSSGSNRTSRSASGQAIQRALSRTSSMYSYNDSDDGHHRRSPYSKNNAGVKIPSYATMGSPPIGKSVSGKGVQSSAWSKRTPVLIGGNVMGRNVDRVHNRNRSHSVLEAGSRYLRLKATGLVSSSVLFTKSNTEKPHRERKTKLPGFRNRNATSTNSRHRTKNNLSESDVLNYKASQVDDDDTTNGNDIDQSKARHSPSTLFTTSYPFGYDDTDDGIVALHGGEGSISDGESKTNGLAVFSSLEETSCARDGHEKTSEVD